MSPSWYVPRPGGGEFYTAERCHIFELLNSPASPDGSLAVARVEQGVTTQLHHLAGIAERYVVRRGEGLVEIGGIAQSLGVGDAVVIPAGVSQRITNTGVTDLEFYCLCTPRFRPESYVNLEA